MPDNPNSAESTDPSQEESLRRFVKKEINYQLKAAQIADGKPAKKFKNSWRNASPIAKAGVTISAIVMLATLANAVAAMIQSCNASTQLTEMHKSTIAAERSAYAACLSAQISRGTLVEIQKGATDSHNLSLGSIAQASAVTRAEAAQVKINFAPHNAEPQVGDEGQLSNTFSVVNVGKTLATSVRGKIRIVVVDRTENKSEEPTFGYVPHNSFNIGALDSTDPERILYADVMNRSSVEKFTRKDIESIFRGDKKRLFIYGEVSYLDIFGVQHWSRKCEQIMHGNGLWLAPKCAAYNQTDRNQIMSSPKDEASTNPILETITCTKPRE